MDLKELSPELNELRSVIIASHLSTCYLLIERLSPKEDQAYRYEKFREDWIEMYKNVYKIVSKMKPRKSTRE
jgi:hypothetical protein